MMDQRTQFESLGCKNHPTEVAGYHLIDQPWVKLCSQCALNIAVSGRKIGKQLSGQQLENKMLLSAITNEMRSTVGIIEEGNKRLSQQVERLELKSEEQIGNQIKKVNDFIEHLLKIRDGLWEMYEDKISKSINYEVEKQSKLILNGIEIKKALENIEANFGELVEDKNSKFPIKYQIEEWKKLNLQTKQILMDPVILLTEFQETKELFYDKIKDIQDYMSCFESPKLKNRDKQNIESVLTETPMNQSIITAPKTCNTRVTQLKLRSNSKKSRQKEIESVAYSRKRKTVQDISNFPSRIGTFQL